MLSFWDLFEICASLFENYVMLDFISRLFEVKRDKVVSRVGFVFTLFVIFTESLIINKFTCFEAFSVFVPIFTLFLYAYVFLKGNMFEKLFISLLIMTIIIAINSVTALFISIITGTSFANLICNQDLYRLIAILVTKLVFFAVTRLLLKFNSINKNCPLNKTEGCMILFSPTVSIFFSSQMVRLCIDRPIDGNTSLTLILLFICILSANFTNYYLFLKINKNNTSKLKLALLQQQYDYHTQNVEQIKNTYDEMRKMRHDLKNNIFCMMALIEQKKYDRAMDYAAALSRKIENTKIFANTNNEALNGIINLKLKLAQDKGIEVICNITDQIIDADDIDICILTANLLDNAIEASQRIERKYRYMEVTIVNVNGDMEFLIKNRINETVLGKNPELLTNKKNNKYHGIGNMSVRSIAEKYNGSVNYYEKDNLFCCKVIIKDLMLIRAKA